MPSVPLSAGFPSQLRPGIGARLLCRFGRAARSALTGISRAGSRRRRTEPPSTHAATAPRGRKAPSPPVGQHAPRRPHPVAPPPPSPTPPGRIARWFGRKPRRPAPSARLPLPDSDDAPFTPETWPGLTPEACAILNTPVEKCDPELLRLVLSVFAQHLANTPALGLTDPSALFATLCQRLGAPAGDMPDTAPPDEAPGTGMQAVPDVPPEPRAAGRPYGPASTAGDGSRVTSHTAAPLPPATAPRPMAPTGRPPAVPLRPKRSPLLPS